MSGLLTVSQSLFQKHKGKNLNVLVISHVKNIKDIPNQESNSFVFHLSLKL